MNEKIRGSQKAKSAVSRNQALTIDDFQSAEEVLNARGGIGSQLTLASSVPVWWRYGQPAIRDMFHDFAGFDAMAGLKR